MSRLDMSPALAERGRGPGADAQTTEPPVDRPGIWSSISKNPSALLGAVILLLVAGLAAFAPLLVTNDPLSVSGPSFLWPGNDAAYPLGTDALGRDVWSGILHGARVSLFVGVAATTLGIVFGCVIGAIAGYFGGWVDDLIVRFIEIFQTIPGFVLLVVLVAIAQPSLVTVILGIALVSWDFIARLTRAEFRSLREKDFVTAAVSAGYSRRQIIVREILPNALPPIIVAASMMVASAILMESALSFLGLSDPNTISWGYMIGAGRDMLRTHWFLSAVPGFFIVATVLALNLLGDGLNDALNPRLRQR